MRHNHLKLSIFKQSLIKFIIIEVAPPDSFTVSFKGNFRPQ